MAMKDYSDEFKADAVALYESTPGATYKSIAVDLGINRATLREWVLRDRERRGVTAMAAKSAVQPGTAVPSDAPDERIRQLEAGPGAGSHRAWPAPHNSMQRMRGGGIPGYWGRAPVSLRRHEANPYRSHLSFLDDAQATTAPARSQSPPCISDGRRTSPLTEWHRWSRSTMRH